MRWLTSLLVALSLTLIASLAFGQVAPDPGSTPDRPGEPIRPGEIDAILLLLSAHHQLPPTARFIETTPNAAAILRLLARSDETSPLHRDRALEALSGFVEAPTLALWREVLEDDASGELVRHRMLRLLALHAPVEASSQVERWLGDADRQRRLTGVAAAKDMGVRGRALLERLLEGENDPLVRAQAEDALGR